MKQLILSLALITLLGSLLGVISNTDLRWLTDHEQIQFLNKHQDALLEKAYHGDQNDLKAVLDFAQRSDQPGLALICYKRLAVEYHSLEDALQWLLLKQTGELDSLAFAAEINEITTSFPDTLDADIFTFYAQSTPENEILTLATKAPHYNTVLEAMAKEIIDEISVEPSDSLALIKINEFESSFPNSIHRQIAFYYKLYHLSAQKDWDSMLLAIHADSDISPVYAYISALFLMSPSFRRDKGESHPFLAQADNLLQKADSSQEQLLLYDTYSPLDWHNRVAMQRTKVAYYHVCARFGKYGDETNLEDLPVISTRELKQLLKQATPITFSNNDRGELSEVNYWLGKLCLLSPSSSFRKQAVKYFCESLRYGSPRRRYDQDALTALNYLHDTLKVKPSLMTWVRQLYKYKGITFDDLSTANYLTDKPFTRVALGDYDADGLNDILFSGRYLYHNDGNFLFTDVSSSANLDSLSTSGGLFADFNRDGRLDIASLSHDEKGNGDKLLKNQDNARFVNVNERAGDIDDKSPSEAAAWVDTMHDGFPSLYVANYEKWQVQSGYPDRYWFNDQGYFSDFTARRGFLLPEYTHDPGQAGRGVAPADFDNDGNQEIYVTNYRLNRNFCWKQVDTLFVDVAALYGLAGKYKQGYYGHSIGADWGDIDNDGDLDLFVANLAHPRYMDISDISMLLRNDGLACHVVEGDSIYYWQFTDITKSAGITYDELHSDPLFFDADNDGYLDLFITSVYENDRSYLYHNNGDGTFTDITWLSGTRVFNGWGNATADLDRDGLLDLVVGSGNGAKIFRNTTKTANKSLIVKPVWKSGKVILESDPAKFGNLPQSPAFGTRVLVSVLSPRGRKYTLIRELSSAKGTSSQSAAELHFGIGKGKVLDIKRFEP